jgi:hypothetical protein
MLPLFFMNMPAIGQADPTLSPEGNAIVKASDVPDLSKIPQFSPQSSYMSLAGFLNLQIHEHSGVWLSSDDRVAAVLEQVQSNLAQMHQGKDNSAER